uniref:Efflux RND transporter periplasmic adaptor subunit n=1 Tax=Thermomicrobium roseum TaxID=500 RepID=A0A7C5VTS6_THERO
MNKRRWWLILLALGLLVFAVIVLAWWVRRPSETLWTVRRGDLTGSLEVPGRIISLRTVSVRATFDTRVQILPVTLGDMVLAGDIVAVLDDTSLKARQKQAEQQLRQAEAALAQAEASEAPLDVRLRAEQQRREAADADREATARLAEKYVLAPLDGIVTEVIVTEGAPVGTGSVLLRIADLHALGVSATVDEVDARYFEAVQDVRVTVDALPGWEGQGKVVAVGRSATQQAGVVGFPLTVRLVDTTERLRPGMTATIHLAAVLRQNVLLVPEQAVRIVGERAFVTVIHDGKREEREVTLGLRSGGMVEVAVGLAEGEQVVLAQ